MGFSVHASIKPATSRDRDEASIVVTNTAPSSVSTPLHTQGKRASVEEHRQTDRQIDRQTRHSRRHPRPPKLARGAQSTCDTRHLLPPHPTRWHKLLNLSHVVRAEASAAAAEATSTSKLGLRRRRAYETTLLPIRRRILGPSLQPRFIRNQALWQMLPPRGASSPVRLTCAAKLKLATRPFLGSSTLREASATSLMLSDGDEGSGLVLTEGAHLSIPKPLLRPAMFVLT